jgi:hypothetical protein
MSQFFILRDEARRQNAIEFIRQMNIAHKPFSVEIKEYRKNRSNSQNRLLWSWYRILSKDTGHTEKELHEEFKVRFLGVEERIVYDQRLIMPKSSADLKVEEFTRFLEGVEMVAERMGIKLPIPDDYRYAMTGKEFAASA